MTVLRPGADGLWDQGADDILATESAYANPYGFTGRRWDAEVSLWYYRNRMYSAELGRFLQRDPLGYIDGYNMYAYVGNRPLIFLDPFGLLLGDDLYSAAGKVFNSVIKPVLGGIDSTVDAARMVAGIPFAALSGDISQPGRDYTNQFSNNSSNDSRYVITVPGINTGLIGAKSQQTNAIEYYGVPASHAAVLLDISPTYDGGIASGNQSLRIFGRIDILDTVQILSHEVGLFNQRVREGAYLVTSAYNDAISKGNEPVIVLEGFSKGAALADAIVQLLPSHVAARVVKTSIGGETPHGVGNAATYANYSAGAKNDPVYKQGVFNPLKILFKILFGGKNRTGVSQAQKPYTVIDSNGNVTEVGSHDDKVARKNLPAFFSPLPKNINKIPRTPGLVHQAFGLLGDVANIGKALLNGVDSIVRGVLGAIGKVLGGAQSASFVSPDLTRRQNLDEPPADRQRKGL